MEENNIITERGVLIEMLKLYKDLPCLWDTSHELYCNREARNQGYSLLKDCLTKFEKDVTLADVKKRVENMRTAYRRERKKVESSKSSGAGTDDLYKPSLWYYEYLMFLSEKQNPAEIGIDNFDDEASGSDQKEPEKKKARKSRKESELFQKQINLVDAANNLITNCNTKEQNSADAFGQSVGSQLKELPNTQRWLAEKMIGEILYYAKIGELNRNTAINLNLQQLYQHQPQTHSQVRLSSPHYRTQWSNSPSPQSFSHSPHYQIQSPYSLSHRSSHSSSPKYQFSSPYSYSHSLSPQHKTQSHPQIQSPHSHSPQHQIQSPHSHSHSPSPQHQIQSPHSPSPQHQIQSPHSHSHSPSPQHQIQSSPLTSRSPHISFFNNNKMQPTEQLIHAMSLSQDPLLLFTNESDSFNVSLDDSGGNSVIRGQLKELNNFIVFKKPK